jgi:hypothetical protein
MMGIDPRDFTQVKGHPGIARKSCKKLMREFTVKRTDLVRANRHVPVELATAGDVYGALYQRLVKRHAGVPKASYACLVPKSLPERAPQGYPHILYGVMIVYPDVTLCLEREVEQSMATECAEHMIKKTYACRDVTSSPAVKVELDFHICLVGLPDDLCCPIHCNSPPIGA